MSLVFDAVGPSGTGNSVQNVSSTSWSHTMGAGANGLMLVCLSAVGGGFAPTGSAVDFNGAAMTGPLARSTNVNYIAGNQASTEFWKLIAPASGAHTVSVTWAASGVYADCASVSYVGADQTTGTGNTNTASSSAANNGSPTVTAASGNIVLDCVGVDNLVAPALTSTQTERYNGFLFSITYACGAQDATGPTPTMSWSWASSGQYVWSGIEILAASAGATTGAGNSTGTTAPVAVGAANARAAASATGSATASAVGGSTNIAVMNATGLAIANAVGSSLAASSADGLASGVTTDIAIGGSTNAALMNGAGTGAGQAVGASTGGAVTGDALAAGTSSVIAVGAVNNAGAGNSAGIGTGSGASPSGGNNIVTLGSATWRRERQKHEITYDQLLADDEQLLKIIAAAMPYIAAQQEIIYAKHLH